MAGKKGVPPAHWLATKVSDPNTSVIMAAMNAAKAISCTAMEDRSSMRIVKRKHCIVSMRVPIGLIGTRTTVRKMTELRTVRGEKDNLQWEIRVSSWSRQTSKNEQ